MKLTKQGLNNFFFILGIAAVVIMLFTFDVSLVELWGHLKRAGYWLIPIIGIWVVIYGINAWAWYCIIQGNKSEDEHVSFLRVFKLTITGYALNYATPVGGLGGEPYRIVELMRNMSKEHATSSVILYAMMHIFAHFWLWFTSIFFYLGLVVIGDMPMNVPTAAVLAIIAVFCSIAFYFFSKGYRNGLVVKLIRLIGKIPGLKNWSLRFQDNHADTLQHIDHQIAALHAQHRRTFYLSLGIELLARVISSLEIYVLMRILTPDVTVVDSILIMAFSSLFSNLMFFMPMQIGAREGSIALVAERLHLTAGYGLFTGILCRLRELCWIVIGLILIKVKGHKHG
jgi:hypothetical protein